VRTQASSTEPGSKTSLKPQGEENSRKKRGLL
jgi:hypothetical protein